MTTEIATFAAAPSIKIWNALPEEVRKNAIEIYGTKENAIAELAMAMIRGVAKKIAA